MGQEDAVQGRLKRQKDGPQGAAEATEELYWLQMWPVKLLNDRAFSLLKGVQSIVVGESTSAILGNNANGLMAIGQYARGTRTPWLILAGLSRKGCESKGLGAQHRICSHS